MARIPDDKHKKFSLLQIKIVLQKYIEHIDHDGRSTDLLEDLHHNITCMHTQHNELGCDACAYVSVCEEGAF